MARGFRPTREQAVRSPETVVYVNWMHGDGQGGLICSNREFRGPARWRFARVWASAMRQRHGEGSVWVEEDGG